MPFARHLQVNSGIDLVMLVFPMPPLPFLPRLGRPLAWPRPDAQPLQGPYRRNQALGGLSRLGALKGTFGPESLAVGPDQSLYASFEDGRIARFDQRGHFLKVVANTGGRPLGLRFHPDGRLLACDARRGLLRVTPGGDVEVLCDRAEGGRLGFADDLEGRPLANPQCHGRGRFHYITQVLEHGQWLYCSSLHEPSLARIALADLETVTP